MTDLTRLIRTVPDFPAPGIQFRDITPVFKDAQGFREVVDTLAARYRDLGIDKVAGVESRGFVLGAPLAHALAAGFVPVRKAGKLPAAVVGEDYALEYGRGRLEVHADAFDPSERVLLVDDLVATGGTLAATVALVRRLGAAPVEACVVIELPALGGRERVEVLGVPLFAMIAFDGH